MNIFLIGYRCVGKTTVGRILAEAMSLPFVDTDELIVRSIGKPIDLVVAQRGWNEFRRCETKIVVNVCAGDDQVVSTGGGVILNPENTAAMSRSGTVVWLNAAPGTIVRRMESDPDAQKSRPALTQMAPFDEVIEVLSQRRPLYRQAADVEVTTDDRSPGMVADEIIQILKIMRPALPTNMRGNRGG